MTTTTAPASYLAALPPPMQAHLANIVRRAVGMSDDEKIGALMALGTLATHYALAEDHIYDQFEPVADMAAELGLLVRQAHDRATETKEN